MSNKCDKCGVELFGQPAINGPLTAYEGPLFGAPLHTPERCRDRLAARLAEADLVIAGNRNQESADAYRITTLEMQLHALRAELAECRAELEAAKREIQVGENLLSRRQVAAEARAEKAERELAECRAELGEMRRGNDAYAKVVDLHNRTAALMAESLKAAEARAERLQAELRAARGAIAANCGAHYCRSCDAGTHNNWRHALHCGYVERLKRIDAAIAETEKEKP